MQILHRRMENMNDAIEHIQNRYDATGCAECSLPAGCMENVRENEGLHPELIDVCHMEETKFKKISNAENGCAAHVNFNILGLALCKYAVSELGRNNVKARPNSCVKTTMSSYNFALVTNDIFDVKSLYRNKLDRIIAEDNYNAFFRLGKFVSECNLKALRMGEHSKGISHSGRDGICFKPITNNTVNRECYNRANSLKFYVHNKSFRPKNSFRYVFMPSFSSFYYFYYRTA